MTAWRYTYTLRPFYLVIRDIDLVFGYKLHQVEKGSQIPGALTSTEHMYLFLVQSEEQSAHEHNV